ncbi:MAG: excinuclease ABC subunit UvrC, partial [Solirubrobacteraceae bacterium]
MENLKSIIANISAQPGVYKYFDENGKILYVGKAKNLKKRVQSYFYKEQTHPKTRILVKKIVTIETLIVDTEYDALILENTLIKKLQPKYNIMLKDDKTYPWICIKNEPFSRVYRTRKVVKDGSEYFGPYPNLKLIYSILTLIKELFPIRSCSLDLSGKKIEEKKYKVCLEFHIKNCLGPCVKNQNLESHNNYIKQVKHLLKGNLKFVIDSYKQEMMGYASKLEFEKAQLMKEKIEVLLNYQQKSIIVNTDIDNVDIFNLATDPDYAYVNYLKIINGSINQGYTLEIKKNLDETDQEILSYAIVEIRLFFNSTAKEIYVPIELGIEIPNLKVTIPKIGDKKRILDLSKKNALEFRLEKLNASKQTDPENHTNRIMKEMMVNLKMAVEPRHIEGFDNSNIQGTSAVSACVVFKNGKPSKKDYRIFNTQTVDGPNDFATMEEVVYRRYKRLLEENEPLPQLIVID